MEFRATHRFADISAFKVRDVASLIRGKHVHDALRILRAINRRASYVVDKVLRSAIANADQSLEADMENLRVKDARVDEGPTRQKWWPRARGRSAAIRARTSHISIVLEDGR